MKSFNDKLDKVLERLKALEVQTKQLEAVSATQAGLMQKLLELKTAENIALLTDAQSNSAKTATEISTACNQNQQQIAVL